MRAYRMRHTVRSAEPPRSRGTRQPVPAKHQSPSLLRLAGTMQTRAEQSERAHIDLQRRYAEQTAELEQTRAELTALRTVRADQASEPKTDPGSTNKVNRIREQLARFIPPQDTKRPEAAMGEQTATAKLQELIQKSLALQISQPSPPIEENPSAEHTLVALRRAEQTIEERNRQLQDLQTRLTRTERAHKEVSVLAAQSQHSLKTEQVRREQLEQRFDRTIHETSQRPPSHQTSGNDARRSRQAQRQVQQLQREVVELRRHRDEVQAQREGLSARMLHLMMPERYLAYAAHAGYDPARDPLIKQKKIELPVLDQYRGWQSQNLKQATARPLDPSKTLDEQAFEAASWARWKLAYYPPASLGCRPQWAIVGLRLDALSENFLHQTSIRTVTDRQRRMGRRHL